MRICLLTILLFSFLHDAFAQSNDPVHFTFTCKRIDQKRFDVQITATLDPGWHLYSQKQPPEAIAMPTKIAFSKNPLMTVAATLPKEVGTKEAYHDELAGIVQYQYAKRVDFVQTVTLKGKAKTTLNGTITYQVCTDAMCLPPTTVPFSISVP